MNQNEQLYPNDMSWSLLSEKDILFFRESFKDQKVVSFCLWIEDQVFSELLTEFSFRRFINDIQSDKKLLSQDFTIKSSSDIRTNGFLDNIVRLMNEKNLLLSTLLDFLYNREVLEFYRKLSMILHPIIQVDIISVSKRIEKKSLSRGLKKKLEERVRLEFAYWTERFVTSWYKDLSQEEISIKGVPIGCIAEYDLITELMLEFPEKGYWNQEDKYEV
ncbi:MAG: hypothetical protein PVG69_07165 [Desulfobacterales bacterium]|jgi:hypothetical protein